MTSNKSQVILLFEWFFPSISFIDNLKYKSNYYYDNKGRGERQ